MMPASTVAKAGGFSVTGQWIDYQRTHGLIIEPCVRLQRKVLLSRLKHRLKINSLALLIQQDQNSNEATR